MRGHRQGHRIVATGFNPFPYLGNRNLPMSILTLNMLGYLAGFGAQTGGFHTGEPWTVPAGVTGYRHCPRGARNCHSRGTLFTATDTQGVLLFESRRNGQKAARAVNLDDLTTSDLADRPPITIATGATSAVPTSAIVHAPLAAYILASILSLIVFESFLVYRRRRRDQTTL